MAGNWAIFQEFVQTKYNPLARQVKELTDVDRRNFEAYITAKVTLEVLKKGRTWKERVRALFGYSVFDEIYKRELNLFLDKLIPSPEKPVPAPPAQSRIIKPGEVLVKP